MALNPIAFTEKVVRSFLRYQLNRPEGPNREECIFHGTYIAHSSISEHQRAAL